MSDVVDGRTADGDGTPLDAYGRTLAGYVGNVPERFVPELMEGLIEAEHVARYVWAGALVAGRRVLDAGCGLGYGSRLLAEAGATEVVGVDLAEHVLEHAARTARHAAVRFEAGDVTELRFPDGSFDVVVCFEVLEHLPEPILALREFRRILRPDGLLVVSSPNRHVFPPGNPHHVHEFVPDELQDALEEHFAHVRLFRQHPWLSSAVLGDEQLALEGGGVELSTRKLAGRQPGSELYTLALASDAAITDPPPVATLTAVDETRRWIERVAELEAELDRRPDAEAATTAPTELLERVADVERSRADLLEQLAAAERTRAEQAERLEEAARRIAALTRQLEAAEWAASEQAEALADAERQLAARSDALAAAEARLEDAIAKLDETERQRAEWASFATALQETVSWRVTRPLRALRGGLARTRPGDAGADGPAPEPRGPKAVLFVSQAPEVARRYRCEHQAEQVALLGATSDVAVHGEIDLEDAVGRYGAFVLHRVPFGPDVERFLARARELGRAVLYDTDDLVFEPEAIRWVAAVERMDPDERALFEDGLHRYRETLVRCDAVLVTTTALAERARRVHDRVHVVPNVVSAAMVARADALLRERRRDERPAPVVTLGYLSGTPTHDRDFLEAADAVLAVLEQRPNARFLLVGPLALDERFDAVRGRVERLPLQPFERLSRVVSRIDVNLAPLEGDNPFTESKSCVKYLEAGALGVPTVASPRPDFRRVIEHGRNGFLAESPDEWERVLLQLVDDRALRREVGRRAAEDTRRRHTTKAHAASSYRVLHELVSPGDQPLTINWVMLSPVAQNSGGYRNIFRIKDELAARGHQQRLCIEPVAHLAERTRGETVEYLEGAFGPLRAELVLGHDAIPPADVTIATFWETAITVAALDRSLFRAYFIQDFEPEFYENTDERYARAARTYELPLRHVCLGRHLAGRLTEHTGVPAATVDFALDDAFRLTRPPTERGQPVKVLFFARPSLRRRGYQLGLAALRRVHEARPDVEIRFFGTASDELGDVPFPIVNLGVLDAAGVAAAMNDAHILLTLSLTNISNVPFEGMACGCAVVDVDMENVSTMVDPGTCVLAGPTPELLARAVVELVDDPEERLRVATAGAASAGRRRWSRTGEQFERALLELCFARAAVPA